MSNKSVVSEIVNSQNGFFGGRAEGQITGVKVLTVADMEKMWVCSGTSADYAVYLPKPSECAGKMVGFRMDPGLTKLVTLDAGQTDNAKTGTVTTRNDAELTSGYVNQTTDNYTGYSFSSVDNAGSYHVGDRLVYSWDNNNNKTDYVTAISPVTMANKLNNGLYNSAYVRSLKSTGIVGAYTTFLTDLTVGGLMWVGGESRTVGWIGDDTHCGVDTPFSTAGSGFTYSAPGTPHTIDGSQTRIMWANEVAILYSDGYKWTKIAGKAVPMVAEIRLSTAQLNLIGNFTDNLITFDAPILDSGGMADVVAHKIKIRRYGRYVLTGYTQLDGTSFGSSLSRFLNYAKIGVNYNIVSEAVNIVSGQYPTLSSSVQFNADAGTEVTWTVRTSHTGNVVDITSGRMAITEIPTW